MTRNASSEPPARFDPNPRQPLWKSNRSDLDLPSGVTSYVEEGAGFPVVLLHGLMGYSFCWRKNITALAEHYRVLALDFAGCGYSAPLRQGSYGIESWSKQLEEFLDTLGVAKANFVASSAGGAVALDFASRLPGRVERMVLVAPVNPFSRRVVFLARAYSSTGMPLPVMRALLRRAPQFMPWLFRHRYYADATRIVPGTIPGYLEGIRPDVMAQVLRQSIREWNPDRMSRQLPSVSAPILLLWGDADKLVPPSCIPRLQAALPGAIVAMLSGAGHFCYEELPEAFNQEVLRFFRRPPPAP